MKIGIELHHRLGVDYVLEEARSADDQGFDSVWLSDHLFRGNGQDGPEGPLEMMTLATAIGAVTRQTRIAWGALNITLRPPALLAKQLASLDQLTHGRVIATLGAGWNTPEWTAYDLPHIEDHDERAAYAREVIQLFKQLWTHPAPELTSFEGKYVKVKDLPFNPEPYQKPHPPIWFGGESDATMQTVKQLCDGWMNMPSHNNPANLRKYLDTGDWPDRPFTILQRSHIIVNRDRATAIEAAREDYESLQATEPRFAPPTFADFLNEEVVGTPDECIQQLRDMQARGVIHLRIRFTSEARREAAALMVLPRLAEVDEKELLRSERA
jgi:alkanesulfonate monooxygenase SsuD/methylene tetrahydromethanopterin reductase-like flavin-dependent oxidoreductase (luciferase family)